MYVALVISIGVLILMAPTVKERIHSLFSSSSCAAAFEGDGILVGDTGSSRYVPSWWLSSIEWKITQQPGFGDAHHTVSLFMVPEQVAHHYLYRSHSRYTSPVLHIDGGMEPKLELMQHIPITTNVYLLPKDYTRPKKEARADLMLNVFWNISDESSDTKTYVSYYVCQFRNRVNYGNFIDIL